MPEQSFVFRDLSDDAVEPERPVAVDEDQMPLGSNVIMEPVATKPRADWPVTNVPEAYGAENHLQPSDLPGQRAQDYKLTPAKTGEFKLDAGKAPIYQGVLKYFPRALVGLAWVSDYGFRKYGEWGGWRRIDNALLRYSDAKARHTVLQEIEGPYDVSDSGLPHALQDLWNAAARVELLIEAGEIQIMRGNEIVDGKPVLGTARPV